MDGKFDDIFGDEGASSADKNPRGKFGFTKKGWAVIAIVLLFVIAGAIIGGVFIGANSGIVADMPLLNDVYKRIKKYYYKDISWSDFQVAAAKAFAGSVDNFTWLTENSAVGEPEVSHGMMISSTIYNEYYVNFVFPSSTATHASLTAHADSVEAYNAGEIISDNPVILAPRAGDRIYGINGVRVENASPSLINALINVAEVGDVLNFDMLRRGEDGTFDGKVYRLSIELKNEVDKYAFYLSPSAIGSDDTAYIRLREFSLTAPQDFFDCVQSFENDPENPKKLILDLRYNGGGSSTILGYIAAFFTPSYDSHLARYVYNKGNGKQGETYFDAQVAYEGNPNLAYGIYDDDFKMTILCNGRSASSSEVLIGALSFYRGVQIVGSRTYGKGVAQTVQRGLSDGKLTLNITNGYYYIPTRGEGGETLWTENIHGKGFTPIEENRLGSDEVVPLAMDPCVLRALEILA